MCIRDRCSYWWWWWAYITYNVWTCVTRYAHIIHIWKTNIYCTFKCEIPNLQTVIFFYLNLKVSIQQTAGRKHANNMIHRFINTVLAVVDMIGRNQEKTRSPAKKYCRSSSRQLASDILSSLDRDTRFTRIFTKQIRRVKGERVLSLETCLLYTSYRLP